MKKICRESGVEFEVTLEDHKFYEKIGVPEPSLCPEERMKKYMSFRNEGKLYKRTCNATNKMIISAYHKDTIFPVYNNKYWSSNDWEALDYGVSFDFTEPFFRQFESLFNKVPRDGTSVFESENCEYNSHIRESKDCYLNSLVYRCEEVFYSYWMVNNRKCLDSVMVNNSELCYECIDIDKCYKCFYLLDSINCNDCHFSFQLQGCTNCIACSNLSNKEYYILNKKVTKEEFFEKKEEILNGKYSTILGGKNFFKKIFSESIHKNLHNYKVENCDGDHLENCNNCVNSFDGHSSEDIKNVISFSNSKNIMDCYSIGWPDCDYIYSSSVIRGSTNIRFSNYIFMSNFLTYCDSCINCNDCFGCIGLKNKKYCILNKQYGKEEYFKLKNKIIEYMISTGEWGEFFPISISPFSYNETVAYNNYPLKKEECLKKGYKWKDNEEIAKYKGVKTEIDDSINNINENILKEILTCEFCNKNYKIINNELSFYKKMNLPIPRKCPNCRHTDRMALRNPRKLFDRKCDKCAINLQSTYSPDREEKIYCEECYKKENY